MKVPVPPRPSTSTVKLPKRVEPAVEADSIVDLPPPPKTFPKVTPKVVKPPSTKVAGNVAVESSVTPSSAIVPRVDGKAGLPVVKDISLPPRECSACHIGSECPEYKEGYVCFFDKEFKSFDVRSMDGIQNTIGALIQKNMERLQIALLSEQCVSGGQPDPNVTRLSEVVLGQMIQYANLKKATNTQQVSVSLKGPQVVQRQGSGVLSRIFGGQPLEKPADILLNPDPEAPGEVTVTLTQERRE